MKNKLKISEVVILDKTYEEIIQTIGSFPAETGGILMGKEEDMVVQRFIFDNGAATTSSSYTFNINYLNPIVKKMFQEEGLKVIGFIHSHPYEYLRPSTLDLDYFQFAFDYNKREYFITPIIGTIPDGGEFKFESFVVKRGKHSAFPVKTKVISAEEYAKTYLKQDTDTTDEETLQEQKSNKITNHSRIVGAVDLDMLRKSKIVVVGTGGSYSLLEGFARTGVGEIVGIDPDKVEDVNLCRQGFLPKQVGMYKVDAIKEHLSKVNSDVVFQGINKPFGPEMTQNELDSIFRGCDLALFLTDEFEAQSFGNIVALRYGIPTIFAGFFDESRAFEIIFQIPGVTPGCFRCAVSPRYEKNAQSVKAAGHTIHLSSNQNTIFDSMRLDATIGALSMMILHRNISGYKYSDFFGEYFDRNYIISKENHFYKSKRFESEFKESSPLWVTYWKKVTQDNPCPDCVGSADVDESIMNGTLHTDFNLFPKPCARRKMNLYYLIDTSSSMIGNKIESINQVMPEICQIVAEISNENKDNAQIDVSCLKFSTDAVWMYDKPIAADQFSWSHCTAEGSTNLGAACVELESKLHRSEHLNSETGHYAPAIIILSDGAPNFDWRNGFEKLKKNKWFQYALKVAIAIGDGANGNGADTNILAEFVCNNEMVITVHTIEALKNILKLVSTNVSQIGSNGSSNNGTANKDILNEAIQQEVKETAGAETANTPSSTPIDDDWD